MSKSDNSVNYLFPHLFFGCDMRLPDYCARYFFCVHLWLKSCAWLNSRGLHLQYLLKNSSWHPCSEIIGIKTKKALVYVFIYSTLRSFVTGVATGAQMFDIWQQRESSRHFPILSETNRHFPIFWRPIDISQNFCHFGDFMWNKIHLKTPSRRRLFI